MANARILPDKAIELPDIALWSQWPEHKLREKKDDDARSFARGYQMQAIDDSELMFPSFKTCREHSVKIGDIARAGWPCFAGVDLASDKRPGTVIFVMAVEPGTLRRYPLSVRLGRWTSPQTFQQLNQVLLDFPSIQTILVENNAYQQSLIDWIQTLGGGAMWVKVEPFTTTQYNKANPMYGLPSLEAEFHKRWWAIPYNEYEHHPPTCRCGWCMWDQQMCTYPQGEITDAVMACWFAREALNRWTGIAGSIGTSVGGLNDR